MVPSDLDFVTYNRDKKIFDIRKDPTLSRVVSLMDNYQAAADENTSVFRHRDQDPQVPNAGAFEANPRGPGPLADETGDNGPTPPRNVVDIIREAVNADLVLQEDGTYQHSFQGQPSRLSEYDRRCLIHFRKVFQSCPDPDYMKKEDEALEASIEELDDYETKLLAAVRSKKAIVTRFNERRRMIAGYLRSLSEPSQDSRAPKPPLKSREMSPPNSIVYDTRGDIGHEISSEDSSTDQSSDEDMEMQDIDHVRPEEPGTDILPAILPTTQQTEETRETDVTSPNEPVLTRSSLRNGRSMSDSPDEVIEIDGSDADATSISNASPSRRIMKLRMRKTDEENKSGRKRRTDEENESGYEFIAQRKASKMRWPEILLAYNAAYGQDRTLPSLQSVFHCWKAEAEGRHKKRVWKNSLT
ncbi:uncharacterized protein N7496_002337 [Penicillium cataractarum]|uniref:Uncharacterized protein n=1 Tax=Penicillium cataractarum TaxID=2100454 RepID=A0A9W9SMD2_9EURO|nr:uncharacterized protein N7496_002337 [Penicillium cataractarum]KAJ5379909.1 hypothetical protein N7496_002337 [Penicillium cataractarum]